MKQRSTWRFWHFKWKLGGFAFYSFCLCQDFLSSVLDVLTPEDTRVLAESEDELSRRGEFERVFPSPASSRYLRFFECPRYLNILLDQWEQKYWNDRTKCTFLCSLTCSCRIWDLAVLVSETSESSEPELMPVSVCWCSYQFAEDAVSQRSPSGNKWPCSHGERLL